MALEALPILLIMLLLPLAVMLCGLILPLRPLRIVATVVSLVVCCLNIVLIFNFQQTTRLLQFAATYAWWPQLHLSFSLGLDGLSLLFICLTNITFLLLFFYVWRYITSMPKNFILALLFIYSAVLGLFMSTNALLFYFCSEALLLPVFYLINNFGGAKRSYASMQYILYALFGSLFLLTTILVLAAISHSYTITSFYHLHLTLQSQVLLFTALLLAIAVKLPAFPLHSWLPDAHTEAPTVVSVILAALLIKVGGYIILRFCLPVMPLICYHLAWVVLILGLLGIIYASLVAIAASNFKRIVAYSSIAHMGFVLLGLFSFIILLQRHASVNVIILAADGAILQLLMHGLVIAGLFFACGMLYQRTKTYKLAEMSGLAQLMPRLATMTFLLILAAIAFPGSGNFIAELFTLIALFHISIIATIVATLAFVLSIVYLVWPYQQIFFGQPSDNIMTTTVDLTNGELLILLTLFGVTLFVGCYPNPVLALLHPYLHNLIGAIR